MATKPDLSDLTHLAVTHLLSALLGAAAVLLLWPSDFYSDLSLFRTIQTVTVGPNGLVRSTAYNPVGLLSVSLAIAGILATLYLASRQFAPEAGRTSVAKFLPRENVAATALSVDQELDRILSFLNLFSRANVDFKTALAKAHSQLTPLAVTAQLRTVVAILVAENDRMRKSTVALEVQLAEGNERIKSLRGELAQAEEVSLKDPLTAVGNRRAFDTILLRAIGSASSTNNALSLVMCDIDRFKNVNDTHGHIIGDEVLKMFARVLSSSLRPEDSVARLGGEEFALLLPNTPLEAAVQVADRIRLKLASQDLSVRGTKTKLGRITASFGVAQLKANEDAAVFSERADHCLYRAKNTGRNKVTA